VRREIVAGIDTVGLTWRELDERYPDLEHRELHDGVLVVTPAPGWPHQRVVSRMLHALASWCDEHGGEALTAPVDLVLGERRVYQPDVWLLTGPHLDRLADDGKLHAPPDLVVEVSSPSTRALDLGAKRAGYAAFAVPEYWFVDLAARAVVVHRATGSGPYPAPDVVRSPDPVTSPLLPGFVLGLADLLRDVPEER
jgi:Uma2 family endonuclease